MAKRSAVPPVMDMMRAAFDCEMQAAKTSGDQYRISGVANSFQLCHSGRLIHKDAFVGWLAAQKKIDIPLMAQHGQTVTDFATIGRVDKLKIDPQRGLLFEAWIAQGTPAADQARALIAQRALRSLSIGWMSTQRRYVEMSDKDIDPWVEERMRDAGVTSAEVHFACDLYEISVVDVPDDPRAELARFGGSAGTLCRADIDRLCAAVETLKSERASERAAFKEMIAEFWKEGENAFLESIEAAVLLRGDNSYAETILSEDLAELGTCGHGPPAPAVAPVEVFSGAMSKLKEWAEKGKVEAK